MKLQKIVLTMLTLLFISSMAQAKEPANTPISTITVQGNSTMEVIPDQAIVSVAVLTTALTANEAQATNAKLSSLLQHKLLDLGIAQDKLSTTQYSVYPIYSDTDRTNKAPVIIGYNVNNTITATLDDITSVGTVIDASLTAGANEISGVHFKKKDELQLKETLLQGAVKEATAKAEAIASALGRHIVKALTVNESGVSVQAPEQHYMMLKSAANTTPISPGTIQANGSVSIVFEID